jgi:hypothetical protein
MVKCAGCDKEFNPPQSHWRYCYDCWMKQSRQKFTNRDQTEGTNIEKQDTL